MIVMLKNKTGLIRQVKVGVSWSALPLGGFVFLHRGIPQKALLWILLMPLTLLVSNVFLMFVINKQTAYSYMEMGYKPVGEGWDIAGPRWDIVVPR